MSLISVEYNGPFSVGGKETSACDVTTHLHTVVRWWMCDNLQTLFLHIWNNFVFMITDYETLIIVIIIITTMWVLR
jgi:hypothetical protein